MTRAPEAPSQREPIRRPLRSSAGGGSSWTLALAAVLAATTVSAGASEARHVADRFLELYYDRSHVADAAQLCTGRAKSRLEFEARFVRGVPSSAPEGKPPVSFELHQEKPPTTTDATNVY